MPFVVKTGCQWRALPNDFLPWPAVYQQMRRWAFAGILEDIVRDLRILVRILEDRNPQPSAAIMDGPTLQSTPESGARVGNDGHKMQKGSKAHAAVDTLGNLLALTVTPANEQERAQVDELAEKVQKATGSNVKIAYVDQGYTGEKATESAKENGVELIVVKHTEAKKGFVLLPRRWVVERTFGWLGRFRRLTRDYERMQSTLTCFHWIAMLGILLRKVIGSSA